MSNIEFTVALTPMKVSTRIFDCCLDGVLTTKPLSFSEAFIPRHLVDSDLLSFCGAEMKASAGMSESSTANVRISLTGSSDKGTKDGGISKKIFRDLEAVGVSLSACVCLHLCK